MKNNEKEAGRTRWSRSSRFAKAPGSCCLLFLPSLCESPRNA